VVINLKFIDVRSTIFSR